MQGPQATTADDGSASTSAASVEPAAAETEEMVSVSPRVFLPAPTQVAPMLASVSNADIIRAARSAHSPRHAYSLKLDETNSVCLAFAQAVTIDKEAERAELVRQMEDAWPARCQVANERLITTLQTKLGAAENKCAQDTGQLLHSTCYCIAGQRDE